MCTVKNGGGRSYFLVTLLLPFYWWVSFSFTVTCEYHCRLTANFVSRCLLQNGGREGIHFHQEDDSVSVSPTIWREELLEQKKMGIKKLYLAEKARGKPIKVKLYLMNLCFSIMLPSLKETSTRKYTGYFYKKLFPQVS